MLLAKWRNYRDFSNLLGADDTFAIGSVSRLRDRAGWYGWTNRPPWHFGIHPTRAAAMRAVAGRCDAKKGYGL
jgi:hypothetical protein